MRNLVIRLFINSVALWVAAEVVSGIELEGSYLQILLVAFLFGLINAFIKPVVMVVSLPFLLLTLGLLTLVINALMLMLTAAVASSLTVAGFWAALWGSLLISVVSMVLSSLLYDEGA